MVLRICSISRRREEVEESKKYLDEINEQIAERGKRYAVYEKKIDKVLAAGKPVTKELAVIRKNAKLFQTILGSEPSVKISEKDFNCLMDMAQASGTLMMVVLTLYLAQVARLMTHQHHVDDSLADSVLASLVADDIYYFETYEMTGTPVIRF